ncbi:winged helix DNA-binding domain-containing protein [Mucor ambiguus]|uniref:Winged helix DNA-binding domain-containing protein n=1 Tax=Mucor ambiguus TaxID=91626 RepID=A0A0C9MFW1_9FUNG|nr:winged helix DNA-binding domain-containing protein [Mucor ambiguus]
MSIQTLISWSDRGDLFSVSNPTAFSKSVLPQYFKHNNWQSFVRQLNMYGFHKVNDMIHSNLTSDNQTWEFKHPHFKRGAVEDLQNVKRKSTKPNFSNLPVRIPNATRGQSENDDDLYGPMYKHILHIEDRLHHVSRSYEILKNETNFLRGLLSQQQQTIGGFATLLNEVLDGEANLGLQEEKRVAMLSKLSELQSNIIPHTFQHPQHPDQFPSDQNNQHPQQQPSPGYPSNTVPLLSGNRTFEQFLHTQQYQLHSRSSYSSQSSSSSLNNVSTNRRLGFGKESHLLNPEPSSKIHSGYPTSQDVKASGEDKLQFNQLIEN